LTAEVFLFNKSTNIKCFLAAPLDQETFVPGSTNLYYFVCRHLTPAAGGLTEQDMTQHWVTLSLPLPVVMFGDKYCSGGGSICGMHVTEGCQV